MRIDAPATALITAPDSADLQPALTTLANVCAIFGEVHVAAVSAERVRAWLRAPHPRLAGRAPLEDLTAGRAIFLDQWIARIRLGNPE